MPFILSHCKKCNQMTNHHEGACQKCLKCGAENRADTGYSKDYTCDCHSPTMNGEEWGRGLTAILTRHSTGKYHSESTFITILKDFIKQVATQAREEEREAIIREIEGMKKEDAYNAHHESCLNREYGGTYCDCGHPEQWKSHNAALQLVIAHIKEVGGVIKKQV